MLRYIKKITNVPDFLDFFSWTNFFCSFWKSPRIVWKCTGGRSLEAHLKLTNWQSNSFEISQNPRRTAKWETYLVYNVVDFPFLNSLFDSLGCLHHRVWDLLCGSGGKIEYEICLRMKKRRAPHWIANLLLCHKQELILTCGSEEKTAFPMKTAETTDGTSTEPMMSLLQQPTI